MITKDFNINIDFKKPKLLERMTFVQGDTGSCRLVIKLTDNDEIIDLTGHTVGVTFLRSDNTSIDVIAAVTDETAGEAEYVLASNILEVPGQVLTEIAIYGGGGERLTSAVQFPFMVVAELAGETTIEEQNDYPVLTQLISSCTEILNAEALRVIAENSRFTAENERETVESSRTSAENTRATNETNRQDAETLRANAESSRVTAESDRANA